MKVILRADVDNLGRLGEIVAVKPGYGRNYLLPQGLASLATPANLKVFEQERRKLQVKNDAVRAEARALADKIEATAVVVEVRVGEGDKLYGAVTSTQIATLLADQGVEMDRRKLVLEDSIRALGNYEFDVKLHPEVVAKLTVKVVRHGHTEEAVPQSAPEAPVENDTEEAVTE